VNGGEEQEEEEEDEEEEGEGADDDGEEEEANGEGEPSAALKAGLKAGEAVADVEGRVADAVTAGDDSEE